MLKGREYVVTLYGVDYHERHLGGYDWDAADLTVKKAELLAGGAEEWKALLLNAGDNIRVMRGSVIVEISFQREEHAKQALQSIDLKKDYQSHFTDAIQDHFGCNGSIAFLKNYLSQRAHASNGTSKDSMELSTVYATDLGIDFGKLRVAMKDSKLLSKYLKHRYLHNVFTLYFEKGGVLSFQKDKRNRFISSITEEDRIALEESELFRRTEKGYEYTCNDPCHIILSRGIGTEALLDDCKDFLANLHCAIQRDIPELKSYEEILWVDMYNQWYIEFGDHLSGKRLAMFSDVENDVILKFYNHLVENKAAYRTLEVIAFMTLSDVTTDIIELFTDIEIEGGKLTFVYVGGCYIDEGADKLEEFEKSLWERCKGDKLMTGYYIPKNRRTSYYNLKAKSDDVHEFVMSASMHASPSERARYANDFY